MRHRSKSYASLELTKTELAVAAKAVPALKDIEFRYSDKVSVPIADIGPKGLAALAEHYTSAKKTSEAAQMISFKKLLENANQTKIGRLRNLEPAARTIIDKLPRRWLYQCDTEGVTHAWLVVDVNYEEGDGQTIPASCTFHMNAWSQNSEASKTFTVRTADIKGGKTVEEVLLDNGFLLENDALNTQYEEQLKPYGEWWDKTGIQLRAKGEAGDRWERVTLGENGKGDRVVLDAEAVEKSHVRLLETESFGDKEFPLPVHPYVYCFHLSMHQYFWIHTAHLSIYVYQPELKNKLILPVEHTDLIDVLTSESAVLQEDFIEGKSGGVTVMCQGAPGVGKTLTAEVYAEVIQRPLYKLHSGQLGTNAAEVEEALTAALKRAERWKAVMLIDEGDVYVRARAADLEQNAVVGVFLRTLEYFNGLLFITTNRGEEVDDAILSRCIAIIEYQKPDERQRRELWAVLAEQFSMKLSAQLIDEAAKTFNNVVGRDIKSYLRLAAKWCAVKKMQPSIEVLKKAASFRGYDATI